MNWGIIGLGNIARRFADSLSQNKEATLYAIASRTKEKRNEFAKTYAIKTVYESYEALLNDSNLDIVYIALPHAMHKEYSIKALKRGLAVLSEKPGALNKKDLEEVVSMAKENNLFYMEAIKGRFVPLMKDIKEVIHSSILGDILEVKADFNSLIPTDLIQSNHYIVDPVQGGAMYDVGIYPVNFVIDVFGKDIKNISSVIKKYKEYQIDGYFMIELLYQNGMKAIVEGALDRNGKKEAIIIGTKGKMIIPRYYRCEEFYVELNDGRSFHKQKPFLIDDMAYEITEVETCLKNQQIQSDKLSFEDSLFMMGVLDTARSNAKDYSESYILL